LALLVLGATTAPGVVAALVRFAMERHRLNVPVSGQVLIVSLIAVR